MNLQEQQRQQSQYTPDQIAVLEMLSGKSLTWWDKLTLWSVGLRDTDVARYEAQKQQGKWTQWLNDKTVTRINAVMDDLDNDMISKTFQKGQEAYDFAQNVAKWVWASDNQWLIYAFAKAMDPDSVVREWEYATVQKYAQVWWDKLGMNINRILNGEEFISEDAKKNMVNTIKTKYQSQKSNYENLRKNKIQIINDIAWKDIWGKILPSLVNQNVLNTPTSTQQQNTQQNPQQTTNTDKADAYLATLWL